MTNIYTEDQIISFFILQLRPLSTTKNVSVSKRLNKNTAEGMTKY